MKDELAGRKIKCPGCSAVIKIPAATDGESDDVEYLDEPDEDASPKRRRRVARDDEDYDDYDDEPVARPRSRKPAKKKSSRNSKSEGTNWLPIVGGVSGALVVVVMLVAGAVRQGQKPAASAAVWPTFKHPLGVAQIDMPGTPAFNAPQSKNGVQTFTLTHRNYQMSLTAILYDANVQPAMAANPATVDLMLNEIQRNLPAQAPGARMESSRPLQAGSVKGLEIKMSKQGTVNLMRFYAFPTALIGAEFITKGDGSYAAERERFFNSFRGPDGNFINAPAGTAPVTASNSQVPVVALGTKPTPPLTLPTPPEPSPIFNGVNLKDEDPHTLAAEAQQAVAENNFALAAQLQYWSVQKSNGDGQYNLACYLSRAGQKDAALYWLQRAALEEGVDANWATQDPDMQPLRSDSRWTNLLAFLKQSNAYWSTTSHIDTQLVMPAGVGPAEPIPVMIGLHGMGSSAAGFIDTETYQQFANQKRVAFLGVSGTIPRGPRSFVWSEDPAKDAARIDAALAEVKNRLTPKTGQLVLFGFSQGGMMAAEVAARFPDKYSGALVMSPGGNGQPQPAGFQRPANGRTQSAVCVCGAGEHPGNVRLTQTYADLFRKAGARVDHKAYPNLQSHSFPPDFAQRLPAWIDFLLGTS